jgi:hypothetical protein
MVEKLAADETAYLFDLACHRALLGSLLDRKGTEAERNAAAAVAALQQAVREAGYDNAHQLKTDTRLALLQMRAGFDEVLRQAEANRKHGKE